MDSNFELFGLILARKKSTITSPWIDFQRKLEWFYGFKKFCKGETKS